MTGRGMTVAQLIEAFREMPQDAEILTHANNHTTGLGTNNDQAVALATLGKETVVLIGNWSSWNLRNWQSYGPKVQQPIFRVRTWGDEQGKLVRCEVAHCPEHVVTRQRSERVEESWELKPSAPGETE